ncbi:MAG TPA: hypothetical protein VGO62_05860, partial [Myxococcota bacterium]
MVRSYPLAVVALLCAPLFHAAPASAQLVHRDPKPAAAKDPAKDKGAKPGDDAKKSDDDDILAPKGGAKPDATSPDAGKPKAFVVGLVGIIPVGDAGKTLADKATAGLLKELGAGHVFDAQALAVEVKGSGAGPDEAAAKTALDAGKSALDKAQKALDSLKFGVAKKSFEQAIDSFSAAAPVLADPTPLIACRLGLAEVAAREGQDDESQAQLRLAAAFNP